MSNEKIPSGEKTEICEARLFRPHVEKERQALARLREARSPRVIDRYRDQLVEWVETSHPERALSPDEIDAEIRRLLDGTPESEHGSWVYYPWRETLVHILDSAEFISLRTDRNRHKITSEEQEILRSKRIGVVGLSVGHSVALTLALERAAGELRIADFDRLGLSNLNRVRAGVLDLGLPKTVITARAIAELDPYLPVRCFHDGLRDRDIEEFFASGGKLDLVIDECDDLAMKIRLREYAKSHGVPVVMETSDRGMLDIERFDLEPQRPLLHGLVGDLDAAKLKGLSTEEKVPFVVRILGGSESLSSRAAASLLEVGSTLKTWPQLGSAVTLGGAVVTDVCRRILLGTHRASGRFHVDLESLVAGDSGTAPLEAIGDRQMPGRAAAPSAVHSTGSGDAEILEIVRSATTAPSGGNSQPWRFVHRVRENDLEVRLDPARCNSFLDFQRMASWMALGCAAEAARIEALAQGRSPRLAAFPDSGDPLLAARISLERTGERTRGPHMGEDARWAALAPQIPVRHTNRARGTAAPLPQAEAEALRSAAHSIPGARLRLLDSREAILEMGEILGAGDRLRFLDRRLYDELMSELRWTPEEARNTGDGIDVETLELGPSDRIGLQLCRRWGNLQILSRIGAGKSLEKLSCKLVASSSVVGLLTVPQADPTGYFEGGRAVMRLWLEATARGIAVQPMTSLPYLFARLSRGEYGDFDAGQRRTLERLREGYEALLGVGRHEAQIMLFRFFLAAPVQVRALRRPVSEVFGVFGQHENGGPDA